mgnify:CR=1 FL=1
MKAWKKWAIGIIATLAITVLALYVIKQRQISEFRSNFIAPQRETQQSILAYANEKGIPNKILVAKDTLAYEAIMDEFKPGTIFVLDKNQKIVDINYGNYNGSCYADIAENICNNFNFTGSKYNHKITDSTFVNKLKTSTVFLSQDYWRDLEGADYTVIFCWAKWMKTSCSNDGEVEKIRDCIQNNKNLKVALISVNTDYVEPWYPRTTEMFDATY